MSANAPKREMVMPEEVSEQSVLRMSTLIDPKKKTEYILCISFNQDKTCIACGTNYGYKIYNSRNFKKIGDRDLDKPIAKIQMLYRSNLLLLVLGSADNMRSGNTLIFWDDKTNDTTGMLTLKHNINKIKTRKDLIYVLHDVHVHIISMESLQIVKKVDTRGNAMAIFACSYADSLKVIAYPSADRAAGYFTMYNVHNEKLMYINAHNHDVECIEMDYNGTVVASASKKGTIIRVFKVKDGTVLQEFRRGIDNAKIMSLCFDMTGSMLGLSSDSGTVHIYGINNEENEGKESKSPISVKNKSSKLGIFKKAFKYFDSEWSTVQLKVDEKIVFVNFNADGSEVLVYKSTGKFWRYEFPKDNEKKKSQKIELNEPIRLLKQG